MLELEKQTVALLAFMELVDLELSQQVVAWSGNSVLRVIHYPPLRPTDPAKGNGVLLFEVANRKNAEVKVENSPNLLLNIIVIGFGLYKLITHPLHFAEWNQNQTQLI